MADLRVGMVGAGSWATKHLDAWKQNEDAAVTAIWNRPKSKAEKRADEYGIPTVYADLDELIGRDDVDVISISMPHNLHYSISLKAIEGGKHVFCEKPLTMTYEEAKELWRRSEEKGVKTGIQFIHRCTPGLQKLRQLIDDGYIGEPQYAEVKHGLDACRDPGFPLIWRFQKNLAGYGVLGDLGVYAIDMDR
jgi:predicted dehydrogenase